MRFLRKRAESIETPDDRGRAVPLFVPENLAILRGAPEGLERAEFRRIRRRVVGLDAAYGATMGMMALLAVWISVTFIYRLVPALTTGVGWFDAAKAGVWLLVVVVAAELMFRGYGRPGKRCPGVDLSRESGVSCRRSVRLVQLSASGVAH